MNRTPRPAANRIVPSHSRWATQSGMPAASATQYQGPMGQRYPMFWWVTVPIPMFGSHMLVARSSMRPGSR